MTIWPNRVNKFSVGREKTEFQQGWKFAHGFSAKTMSSLLIHSKLVTNLSDLLTVAHQKWATMSNSLRSLRGNEWLWANCSRRSGQTEEMSDRERIAQVAHPKWANRSLFWANHSFAHFMAKNEQFAQKTNERIPSPASKYRFLHSSLNFIGSLQWYL